MCWLLVNVLKHFPQILRVVDWWMSFNIFSQMFRTVLDEFLNDSWFWMIRESSWVYDSIYLYTDYWWMFFNIFFFQMFLTVLDYFFNDSCFWMIQESSWVIWFDIFTSMQLVFHYSISTSISVIYQTSIKDNYRQSWHIKIDDYYLYYEIHYNPKITCLYSVSLWWVTFITEKKTWTEILTKR